MGAKEKDKSLLEIAIELLQAKRKPQKLLSIVSEVMEIKGYKPTVAKEHTAQFILDFMQSGYFVYCGDDCWDLKERQTTAVLDKDGGDYEEIFEEDEDVKKNELNDDLFVQEFENNEEEEFEEDSDDDTNDDEDDDLAREFDSFNGDDEGVQEVEGEYLEEDEDDEEEEEDDEIDLSDDFK